jgi:GTP:adenosylcobinamide-phosphate guanylyltransferase
MPHKVTLVVLAGQRAGVVNPLAKQAGVSHKCLVPIAGKPLLAHVLDTITGLDAIHEIVVSLEDDAMDQAAKIAARFDERGVPVRFSPARRSLVDSILTSVEGVALPVIITTADNVLLTRAGVEQVRSALGDAEVVFALAQKEDVLAAHPEGQRNFYKFRDGEFANCNIYGLATPKALESIAIFSEGGQFMKNKGRMVRAFGLFNIIGVALRLFTTAQAASRIGARFGVTCARILFRDGSLAIDVDNERTYACCETILEQRASSVATGN